ncbi:putative membrane protein [Mycobacterium lepraemurium]|nr:putative membrane protein [Mycobacterium lepraemurium]
MNGGAAAAALNSVRAVGGADAGRGPGRPVPAVAGDLRLEWPLHPPPVVVRAFDAPAQDWHPGHRGVDLAGTAGQPVYAAGAGTVVFAGLLAGRPGGIGGASWRAAHQLRAGPGGGAGRPAGDGADGAGRAAARAPRLPGLSRWRGLPALGAMWGPASGARYVDPLGLVASTPIRLKPLGG